MTPFPPPRNPQAPLPRCNFSNETQSVERGGSLPVCFKLEIQRGIIKMEAIFENTLEIHICWRRHVQTTSK